MAQERGEEYVPQYPRKIVLKDGSIRTVNNFEEEATVRQEEQEQD